jgi:hypothetical protein
MMNSVTQHTDSSKAFFTFKLSCRFTVHKYTSFIFAHNKSSLRFSLSRFSWKSQVINSISCVQLCCTQFQADRTLPVDSTDRALVLYARSQSLTFTGSNCTTLTITEGDGEKFIWALDYAIFTKLMLAGQLLAKNAYTEFHEIPSNSSVAGIKRLVDTRDMVSKERLNLSVCWSLSIIASPCVKTNMSVAGQDFETRCF